MYEKKALFSRIVTLTIVPLRHIQYSPREGVFFSTICHLHFERIPFSPGIVSEGFATNKLSSHRVSSSPFWSSSPSWPPPWPSGPTTAAITTPTPLCTPTPTTTASLLSPTYGNEHFSLQIMTGMTMD
ncbi:hypothetical protein CDAR_32141 [Caerostris darwini]|uniref:Cytochrome c biogenesis B n=1 Tax=Caerostris darwini TaxID=1538125 RepID=A0AAV4RP40_9ARAC|nr:hypothetical protein CDAR_32141 [Caerostris darwini]